MLQQTTLNLIAIGVFLMVLSVLVGPLIQLPPAIPAGVTLTVMVLFAADTLAWQGRVGSLVVDGVARFAPEHRDRILHHEAGHFITAYAYGIPILGYTLSAWEAWQQQKPGFGGVELDGSLPDAIAAEGAIAQKQWLDRICIVWMAGIAAERLCYDSVEGGNDDRQRILAALTLTGQSLSGAAVKQQWAELQAKSLMERHRPAYDALVAAMADRASVADCCHAMAAAGLAKG